MKANQFFLTPASLLTFASLLAPSGAWAINAKYAQQLERSGCTQVSESQGCDIHKTKAENAKAGFGSDTATSTSKAAPAAASTPKTSASAEHPYAGQWIAKSDSGATVAKIRIDAKEHVWVNDKSVKAKRSDGSLVFKTGTITFRIQGDRRLKGEDTWTDSDAGTKGLIYAD